MRMFQLDYLLALALLAVPPTSAYPPGTPREHARLRPALQQVAVQWEILDPREARYVLNHSENLVSDLNLLRRRFGRREAAPPLRDCRRFPDRGTINNLLSCNREYRERMAARQSVEMTNGWDLCAVLRETDQLYQIWDTVRDARCEYFY